MATLQEISEYFKEQGVWDREIEELKKHYMSSKEIYNIEDWKIDRIENGIDFAETYLYNNIDDFIIQSYINSNLEDFAKYLADNLDDVVYLESSKRVIIFNIY